MSLTSCYKYAIELPESSLTALLRSVVAQGGTADLPTTHEDHDVPVDGHFADISARLVDNDDRPSAFELTATNLAAVVHLHMDIEVTVTDVPGIDPIVYQADFEIPGNILRNDAITPRRIEFRVGIIDVSDLNLVLSGGELVFTAALFEPAVHQMFADNPNLHHFLVPNVNTFVDGVVAVQVWLYDNPTDGEITVAILTPGTLQVSLPGRMSMTNVSALELYNFPITLRVDIAYASQPSASGGDELVVKVSEVQDSDVEVEYGPGAPSYQLLMTPFIRTKVVATFSEIGDLREPIPSETDIRDRIGEALVDFASGYVIPLFPLDPTASSIPLDTAVPVTLDGAVLALQIEDEPGEPCDGPEDFTQSSGVAIGMGAVEAQRRLDAAAHSMDGHEIAAADYGGDYDVTVGLPNVKLEDAGEHGVAEGHFWVEGSVTIHVGGCVGDVDADYWGPLMLDVSVNADQAIAFQLRAGTFGGDADVKEKKDDFDPAIVADFIAGWDFDFPTIPTVFTGVGTLTLNLDAAEISRSGIVLRGGVVITLLQMLQLGSIMPYIRFWDFEGPGGG